MNLSTMLDTADIVSGDELRFKELPIEARHSICLEISKKRRQSVATSIFIPKELSNHIKILKKNQRRDANKKSKLRKTIITEKNASTTTIAKYKNKYFKRKTTTAIAHQKAQQQQKSVFIKHPESYPIPNKLAQNDRNERLRSLLGVLREDIVPSLAANEMQIVEKPNPLATRQLEKVEQEIPYVTKQLEIVEQQIPLGSDQNLTISFAVEVPDNSTALTSIVKHVIADDINGTEQNLSTAHVVLDDTIATPTLKREILDSSYECIEKISSESSITARDVNACPLSYTETHLNNTIPYSAPIKESIIASNNLLQLPKCSSFGKSSNPTDCNALKFFDYHHHMNTIPLVPTMQNFDFQLLENYQRVISRCESGHNNNSKANYTTLSTSYFPPKTEQQQQLQSTNFYQCHQEDKIVPDPHRIAYPTNYNNPLNLQNQMTAQPAATKQMPSSCRHSLHRRNQNYLNYALQQHGSGLDDPLVAKAWHYTMQKSRTRFNRSRRAANTPTQDYSKPIVETTNSWHNSLQERNGYGTVSSTTYPYNTTSMQTQHQSTPAAPLPYTSSQTRLPANYYQSTEDHQSTPAAPLPYTSSQTRLPANYYQSTEDPYVNPIDLTTYAYAQQPQVQRDQPTSQQYQHHHHHHQYEHPHRYQHPQQHSHPEQQHTLQSQYLRQQQRFDFQQQLPQQSLLEQQHLYPHQHLQPHPPLNYVGGIAASYPPQIQRLSQAFAQIPSAVLPHHIIDPSYWFHFQQGHLYNHRSSANIHNIASNSPVIGHGGTYINNGLY